MESTCPICNDRRYKIIGKPRTNRISEAIIDKDYYVVQCLNCKVYYVSPQISFSRSQWAKLYNSEYFSLQSKWLLEKRANELTERFSKALKHLPQNNISFLDVGTGEGKALIEGLKRNWNVTGIDIVDNRIEEAKSENINFITANFLEYNFPVNHFDFIYFDSVLEHVINPLEYLHKIKKILKENGIVYVGIPNEDSLFNYVRKFIFYLIGRKNISVKIKPFDSPYHVIGFNKKSLSHIFNKTNLSVIYMRNFGRKFDFLGHKINQKGFWIGLLFLLPVEFIGKLIKKDVYFEVFLTKK